MCACVYIYIYICLHTYSYRYTHVKPLSLRGDLAGPPQVALPGAHRRLGREGAERGCPTHATTKYI